MKQAGGKGLVTNSKTNAFVCKPKIIRCSKLIAQELEI